MPRATSTASHRLWNDGSGGGGDHAGGVEQDRQDAYPVPSRRSRCRQSRRRHPSGPRRWHEGRSPRATGEVVRFGCAPYGAHGSSGSDRNPARPRPSVPHRGGLHGRRHLDRERRAGFSVAGLALDAPQADPVRGVREKRRGAKRGLAAQVRHGRSLSGGPAEPGHRALAASWPPGKCRR